MCQTPNSLGSLKETKGDELLNEKITLKTDGKAESFVPNTEFVNVGDVNPDGMDPAVHEIASSGASYHS